MTITKMREKILIRMIKMGLNKSGSQNEIAKRIKRVPSAVSMALSGYQDDTRKEANATVLREIEQALDNWTNFPSVAA